MKLWTKELRDYLQAEYSADFEKGLLIHKRDNAHYWSAGDIQYGWKNKSKTSPYLYITTFVNGKKKTVKIHHVIWFLYHGKQPRKHIDHIKGLNIPHHNAISNLRAVSRSNNCLNSCKSFGKSGVRGVQKLKKGNFKVIVRGKQIGVCENKWVGYRLYRDTAPLALGDFYRPQLNPCNIWMVKPTHPDYQKYILGN
ncbi:hypothetical protein [Escherichia coli]|uniref:hypothetical protein n=1 Tax=Escherichia coli TaxID=562 RepID=UPI0037DD325D